ncbi:MAG: circularly permuted type 2 ATP-grasp protein [Rubrobacteraceae bacterium]
MEIKGSFFNEVYQERGVVRGFYEPLVQAIRNMGEEKFAQRCAEARGRLRELGATFPLPDSSTDKERVLPADWIPRIIPQEHWERISAGVLQRGRAINAWLTDLYGAGQEIVPQEIIESSVFYRPHQLPGGFAPIQVYGPDLVHLGDGEYVILEDNVRVPSGVAYTEAIRRVGLEVLGELFAPYEVSGVVAYYNRLCESLEASAPEGVEDPCIAVMTRGEDDSAYFEHNRIAETRGFRVLTLADCYVEAGELRDRSDGQRIDVVYRRFDEDYIETDLPELEEIYLEGRVTLANAPGVGVADDKAVFPYVPAMIRAYLDEEPILANAPTHSLSEPDHRDETLNRLDELVLKPREGYGAQGLLVGPEANQEEVESARQHARENPTNFIAQETLDFSTHILGGSEDQKLGETFIDLRAFVLPAAGYVMPGGLTRVANPGTRVVNSSAGGRIKDTWVLER